MDSETRIQALRGAAATKTVQCGKPRDGHSECQHFCVGWFSRLKSERSKGRVRRVPAAAVIPAARVVLIIIELKAFVAGPVNPWVNRTAQLFEFRGDCRARDRERFEVLSG